MATSLNNDIRDEILEKMIKDCFLEREQVIQAALSKIADEIYFHEYGEFQERMDKLPDKFFNTTDSFTFTVIWDENDEKQQKHATRFFHLGRTIEVDNRWRSNNLEMTEQRRFPYHAYGDIDIHVLSDFYKRIADQEKQLDHLMEDVKRFKLTTTPILKGFRTVESLLKQYPSFISYIPNIDPVTKGLAVRDEDVRALITCSKQGDCV